MKQLTEHLFLIGFMGVGKTTTSRALSTALGVAELDTDAMIVAQEEMSINDIFAQKGEAYFRQTETALLDTLREQSPSIISCGGGMVMRPENVARMKSQGKILLLTAKPETIYDHVKDSDDRPLLRGHMNVPYIAELMAAREPAYKSAADIVIETDDCTPKEVADKVIASLPKQ